VRFLRSDALVWSQSLKNDGYRAMRHFWKMERKSDQPLHISLQNGRDSHLAASAGTIGTFVADTSAGLSVASKYAEAVNLTSSSVIAAWVVLLAWGVATSQGVSGVESVLVTCPLCLDTVTSASFTCFPSLLLHLIFGTHSPWNMMTQESVDPLKVFVTLHELANVDSFKHKYKYSY